MIRTVWYLIVHEPVEVVAALSCLAVTVSCVLLLNHMPKGLRRLPEKVLIAWVALGAFGGAVGPLAGVFIQPTWAELMMYTGVGVFSLWLTWPYWHELPMLDRRSRRRRTAVSAAIEETSYDRRTA